MHRKVIFAFFFQAVRDIKREVDFAFPHDGIEIIFIQRYRLTLFNRRLFRAAFQVAHDHQGQW